MKSLEKQREDNRMECVKNCPPDNGSFCEKHFQIDCEFSRRIGERDNCLNIENARMEIENCPKCANARQYADVGETMLCNEHYKNFSDIEGKIIVTTKDDCPNCADQASIAAPGQTVLCKTHSDEKHYAEMKEFFVEEIEKITFRPHLPFCSCCGKETSQYVGIIVTNSSGPLSFSFCIDCRDELTLKQNAARAAFERIGA